VGGLYKDQGLNAVREWLTDLLKPRVEVEYRVVREEYLLPPVADATPQSADPTTGYPPPPSPHNTERALRSGPTEDPGQPSRRAQPQANRSQRGSGQARSDVGARSEAIDQPGNSHRGQPASPRGVGHHDASK
jgi:hypothetical protein